MKDEYGGKSILKFADLKSKIYSIISKFVGLILQMYSILHKNNNKKCTNKGHNAFIEFKEFDLKMHYFKKVFETYNERNKV